MNLRLQNPFRGSKEPGPLALRLVRFLFTAMALAFLAVSARIFRYMLQRHAGVADAQELPERPRRIAVWMCHATTAFLILGLILLLVGQLHAVWALLLASVLWFLAGRYLGRTAWGLTNAFHEERRGRLSEVVRRALQVLRHGTP